MLTILQRGRTECNKSPPTAYHPRSLDHDPPHPSPRGGLIPLISFDPPGHGSQCRRDKSSLDMAIGHLPQQPSG